MCHRRPCGVRKYAPRKKTACSASAARRKRSRRIAVMPPSAKASMIASQICGHSRYSHTSAAMVWEYLEWPQIRSEEHTSELQSQSNLVCRLLLEKKKKT